MAETLTYIYAVRLSFLFTGLLSAYGCFQSFFLNGLTNRGMYPLAGHELSSMCNRALGLGYFFTAAIRIRAFYCYSNRQLYYLASLTYPAMLATFWSETFIFHTSSLSTFCMTFFSCFLPSLCWLLYTAHGHIHFDDQRN